MTLNILFVTQNCPHPAVLHGGGRDIWSLIDTLRQRHNVYLLSFDDPDTPVSEQMMKPQVKEVCIIRYATTFPQKIYALGHAFALGYRDIRTRRRVWEMEQLVRNWCDRYQIDVLHCVWTEMGRFLSIPTRSLVRVLDEVDVRFAVEENLVARKQLNVEIMKRNQAEEIEACLIADIVITRSQFDLDILHEIIPTLNGMVVPPVGYGADLLQITPEDARPGEVLFVGAMNRFANIEAARWLVYEIWPLVRAQFPTASLTIAGAYPTDEVLAMGRQPSIKVTGYVPALTPYYAQTRVVVAPTQIPAGSLNKIIDALSAGRPVVATTLANRGTRAPCVEIADTTAEFAQKIVNLLSDDQQWNLLGHQGRAFALEHHDWPGAVQRLEENYIRAVAAQRPATSPINRRPHTVFSD